MLKVSISSSALKKKTCLFGNLKQNNLYFKAIETESSIYFCAWTFINSFAFLRVAVVGDALSLHFIKNVQSVYFIGFISRIRKQYGCKEIANRLGMVNCNPHYFHIQFLNTIWVKMATGEEGEAIWDWAEVEISYLLHRFIFTNKFKMFYSTYYLDQISAKVGWFSEREWRRF